MKETSRLRRRLHEIVPILKEQDISTVIAQVCVGIGFLGIQEWTAEVCMTLFPRDDFAFIFHDSAVAITKYHISDSIHKSSVQ